MATLDAVDRQVVGVPERLISNLSARGLTDPFPIQVSTLPDTLAGRDVLGRGKTGSGKTLAFSIPLVARLATAKRRPKHPTGLVLAPTRELATQITATLEPLAASYGLKVTTIFGGVSQTRQESALNAGVDIVVACPGRLEDLMRQRLISLDAVDITVLDEADHMADLGFLPVVTRIMDKTPTDGQRMLFSATLDNGVDKLVKRYLHDPVMHSVDEANSPVAAMTHHVFEVSNTEAKTELVRTLASGTGRRILFMRTKHHAKRLAKQLTASGVPAVDLHGNLSQPQRDRNLAAFGEGSVRVLVATDVAARGVHVDDVELVIHVDPPMEHKAYLHRSGRTARAGSEGDVVTICLPEQRKDLAVILRKAAITVRPQAVTPSSPAVAELVGQVAEYVKPAPAAAVQPSSGSRGSTGRGGRRQSGAAPERSGSQGVNAQRKRAGRDDRDARNGAAGGQSRHDNVRRSDAAVSRHDGGTSRHDGAGASRGGAQSSGAPHGNRSNGSGRTAASGRSGGLRVGSLVNPNSGAGRARGSRRAQG
ncbi:MAG TPA: DEAD/DEAH box helicase [Humibacter sp.]|nr:DEAD/DEAH box helicase [Humibacter sp.]